MQTSIAVVLSKYERVRARPRAKERKVGKQHLEQHENSHSLLVDDLMHFKCFLLSHVRELSPFTINHLISFQIFLLTSKASSLSHHQHYHHHQSHARYVMNEGKKEIKRFKKCV